MQQTQTHAPAGDQFFEAASNGDTAAWQLPEGSQIAKADTDAGSNPTNPGTTAVNTEDSANDDEQAELPSAMSDEAMGSPTAPGNPAAIVKDCAPFYA